MKLNDLDSSLARFLYGHAPFASAPMFAPGEMVGDWKVQAFLGRGGSGEVYRAENIHLGSFGALKVLSRDGSKARDRFRLEARLLAETTCAAFPLFCAYGEDGGRPYVVTEMLEPIELPSKDCAVAKFIDGVCVGVAELHRLGYVHRDIKPSNIMRRPSTGEPVLIDLGLVRASDDTPLGRNSTLSVVDGQANGVGTPGYSAPEQFSGGAISSSADIHALGVLINECFNGNPHGDWSRIVRRSTSSIPEQRYASVEQFVKAVRHRHRTKRLAGALSLCLAASLCAFLLAARMTDTGRLPDSAERQPKSIMDIGLSIEDMRRAMQDTSVENVSTNVQYVNWDEIGKTYLCNETEVTEIWLDNRTLKVKSPVVLSGRRKVYIAGPGLLDADISGSNEVVVCIARNATLLNRTRIEYPESGIAYSLIGDGYLNFVNLAMPKDKAIGNVYSSRNDGILRFGGPLSYREARADEFRKTLEAERRKKEHRRNSHNLRDIGVVSEPRMP